MSIRRSFSGLLAVLALGLLGHGLVEAGAPATASWFSNGTLGHGTKPASGQALTGGSTLAGGTVALAYGGTGATTAPVAQSNLAGGLGRIPVVHTTTSAPGVGDDSADGFQVGDFWQDTSGDATYIADGVSVGAADWRRLLTPNAAKIGIAAGAFYAQAGLMVGSTFTPAGAQVAPTSSGDPNSFGATLSGTSITVNAATAAAGNADTTSQYWSFDLASLNLTIPAGTRAVRIITEVSSHSEGARTATSNSYVSCAAGTGAQAAVFTAGWLRPGSGTAYNLAVVGGSGGYSSSTGQSSTVKWDVFSSIGDTLNTGAQGLRFDTGNDVTAAAQVSSIGGRSATIPTHFNVYDQITTASTLTGWTLNDFTCYLRW